MISGLQKLCAWSGIGFVLLFVLGMWVLAGMVPPPSPAADAATVGAFFSDNASGIRLGMLVAMIASGLYLPWTAVLTLQMKRMQGVSPVLPLVQAISGAVVTLILLIPVMLWATAAFRVDRSPELILLLNDFAWLFILMTFPAPTVQVFAVGLSALLDKSVDSVFPRWVGFVNLWLGTLFLPGGLIVFFKTGPFAWDGFIAFWIPFAAFGLWFLVMTPVLLRAIRRQALTPN